jgi:hypothetical protein
MKDTKSATPLEAAIRKIGMKPSRLARLFAKKKKSKSSNPAARIHDYCKGNIFPEYDNAVVLHGIVVGAGGRIELEDIIDPPQRREKKRNATPR